MSRLASILTVCILAQTTASGGSVHISGSGNWGSSAPITALSAPGERWSFSFDVDVTAPIGNNTTLTVSNPSYLLNGTPVVSETINAVQFFDTSEHGLFDLIFPIPNSSPPASDELSLYGEQVFDANGNLIPDTYKAAIDFNGTHPPTGTGMGTVVIGQGTVVPEPTSIITSGIAAAVLAGVGLVRRRIAA